MADETIRKVGNAAVKYAQKLSKHPGIDPKLKAKSETAAINDAKAYFKREFKVKVAWCLKEGVPALLGRRDIFDHFHVLFKQDEKVIEFKETEKLKSNGL